MKFGDVWFAFIFNRSRCICGWNLLGKWTEYECYSLSSFDQWKMGYTTMWRGSLFYLWNTIDEPILFVFFVWIKTIQYVFLMDDLTDYFRQRKFLAYWNVFIKAQTWSAFVRFTPQLFSSTCESEPYSFQYHFGDYGKNYWDPMERSSLMLVAITGRKIWSFITTSEWRATTYRYYSNKY